MIAKLIMPGDDPGGFIVTTLIGIAGAIVGGLIASALDVGDLDEFFDIGTWLIAIAGSLLLLAIYRAVVGHGHREQQCAGRKAELGAGGGSLRQSTSTQKRLILAAPAAGPGPSRPCPAAGQTA